MSTHTTRLAPSPTGALHLGNARTFLINWALARQDGWRVVLRIEDLDTPRVRPGASEQTVDLLRWLGMDWDEQVPDQSNDLEPYRDAMRSLAARGRVYPCHLSRSEVEAAASAPHDGDSTINLPPTRPSIVPNRFEDGGTNWRFICPPDPVHFDDRFAGPQSTKPANDAGDFIVWTQRDQPSYQLAVVVDDHRQGITQIVRGDDLISSTGRQLLLYRAMDLSPEPDHWHLPLVRGPDGRRLAKRHGDSRLDTYRAAGVDANRVIGLVARWSGISDAPAQMTADEFADRLDRRTIPREDVVFSAEDDRWLRGSD